VGWDNTSAQRDAARANVGEYVNRGGRMFASHFGFTWLSSNGGQAYCSKVEHSVGFAFFLVKGEAASDRALGVLPSFPSWRSVSYRVNPLSARLALALALGLVAACSRPDGDVLYRPFQGPGHLDDGLPEGGEVLVDGEPLADAGLGPDAQGPAGDAGHDSMPDAGGAASIPDAASGADAGSIADGGGDAGALPTGDAGPGNQLGYWAFDDASELLNFELTDSGIVSAQEWHAADQHAATGHLVLTASFTGGGDGANLSVTPQAPLDLAGHLLKLRIQRLSGTRSGGVRAFA